MCSPSPLVAVIRGAEFLGKFTAIDVVRLCRQPSDESVNGGPDRRFYVLTPLSSDLVSVPELLLLCSRNCNEQGQKIEVWAMLNALIRHYFFYDEWRGRADLNKLHEVVLWFFKLGSDLSAEEKAEAHQVAYLPPYVWCEQPTPAFVADLLSPGMFAFCFHERLQPDLRLLLSLGVYYAVWGAPCSRDYLQALRYFKIVAYDGSQSGWLDPTEVDVCAVAQFYLGMMYLLGFGVARNPFEAYVWFRVSIYPCKKMRWPRCTLGEDYCAELEKVLSAEQIDEGHRRVWEIERVLGLDPYWNYV